MSQEAAARYAKALFLLSPTDYREPLNCFLGLLKQNPVIDRFFNSPHISLQSKSKVLEKGVEKGLELDPALIVFLKLLLRNQRFSALPEIIEDYGRRTREKLGIAHGVLKSASPLSEEQKKGVLDKLKQFTRKQMELEFSIDPKLLGGGVLTLNHHLIDFSVKGKLTRLEEELLK
jgi:F-type H+-transporting ATPase subunit delta